MKMHLALFVFALVLAMVTGSLISDEKWECLECMNGSTHVRNGKPVGDTCNVVKKNKKCYKDCGGYNKKKFKEFYASELKACKIDA